MAPKNPMAATWTKAAQVRRMFKAGRQRQKDLRYDAEQAVMYSRLAFVEIRKEMNAAGLRGEDIQAALVMLAADDRVQLLAIPRNVPGIPDVYEKAAKLERAKAVPLGVAFWQRDRETEGDGVDVWVQSWLTGERAVRAAAAARKAFEESAGTDAERAF